MIKRVLIICVGLVCGAGASQAPEFTQQYLQRLGGWVDAHQDKVTRLDARAAQFDMTREQYIAALQASTDPKVRKEAANIASWPVYLKQYTEMQRMLQSGPSWMQPYRLLQNYNDPAFAPIVQATLADYKPGTPITAEGAAFGGAGFVGGWLLTVIGAALLGAPINMIRRRREKPKNLPNLVMHRIDEPTLTEKAQETEKPEET
ncbi:MAG: DUF2937 family protein [Proteobacteria bacterium]|nr:DUF2937 family protein [Pseudomonadota bacterium]